MAKHTRAIMMQVNSGEVSVCLGELSITLLLRALETDDAWVSRPLRTILNDHINDTNDWLENNPGIFMPDLEPLRYLLLQMAKKIEKVQQKYPGRFHKFEGHI